MDVLRLVLQGVFGRGERGKEGGFRLSHAALGRLARPSRHRWRPSLSRRAPASPASGRGLDKALALAAYIRLSKNVEAEVQLAEIRLRACQRKAWVCLTAL
jgi:hypothetical protein